MRSERRGNPDQLSGTRVVSRRAILKGGVAAAGGLALGPTLLAACSSSADKGTSTTSLRVGIQYEPVSFDPFQQLLSNTAVVENCNISPLYYTDVYKPVAQAATWKIAPGNKSVEMTLKPGLTFQSGKQVSSDDIVAVLDRGKTPDGLNFHNSMTIVDGYEKVDARTVRIAFTEPTAESAVTDFLLFMPIIDSTKDTAQSLAQSPAGAGPYRLADFQPGESLTLEKFDKFLDGSLPHLDQVKFTFFDSADTMSQAFRSGSLDAVAYVPAQIASQLKGTATVSEIKVNVNTDCVVMNPSKPPFDNKFLRMAIQRTVNRDRIVKEVSLGFGSAIVSCFAPGSPTFEQGDFSKYSYDLTAAKALYEKAGRPGSGEALVQGTNADIQRMMQIIQADLKSIGFDLQIKPVDQQTFNEQYTHGDFGLVILGTGGNLRNPAAKALSPVFAYQKNPLWGDKLPAGYAEAMQACAHAMSDDELRSSALKLKNVMLEEVMAVGIRTRPFLFAAKPGVQHLIPTSYAGMMNLRECAVA